MEIAVLGRQNTITSFKLAGVKNTILAGETDSELLSQFESLTRNTEIAVLVVDDACAPIRSDIIQYIETHHSPIIVEIPSRNREIREGIIDIITKRASGAK